MLVIGSDWARYVSGRDVVEANGGTVVIAGVVQGKSKTGIIEKVLKMFGKEIQL